MSDPKIETIAEEPSEVSSKECLFPNAVYTGHLTKKGDKIYKSTRVKKDGTEKVSFFTINENPSKRSISKSWLMKNNMSFIPYTTKHESTANATLSGRN